MLNASFPIYLQLSMNWKMTVNAISYGVMPYGPTSAGCIGRDIMIFPSGSCHALTKKRNIFSKAWRKSAGYLAVWDFFVTHTHTHTHTHRHARQDTKKYLIFNQLVEFFFSYYLVFPYKFHAINTIPPPLPSWQRREDCALSGGMRYMDMLCPYAAGKSFM